MRTLLILGLLAIGGCSSAYYASTAPTAETVPQIYRKTLFESADFRSGLRRPMSDYDFNRESAPCDVMPAYAENASYNEQFYELRGSIGGRRATLWFVCRDKGGNLSDQRRLFLLGSREDCRSRTWKMGLSVDPFFRSLDRLCSHSEAPVTLSGLLRLYEESGVHRIFR